MDFEKPARSLVVLWLAATLGACTNVPQREFAAYKEAFGKARAAGEQVVLDYGVTAAAFEELEEERRERLANSQDVVNARRTTEFDVRAASNGPAGVDHIKVRMQAWEVVARYNDALTALAEGKSAGEVAGAVEGLVESLTQFPIEEIGEAAADLTPWLGAMKALLAAAQSEWSRREFARVVKAGSPVILDGFIPLLIADAQNFYNVHLGLNELEYRRKLRAISDAVGEFRRLADAHRPDGQATELAAEIDAILGQIPGFLTGDAARDAARKVSLTPNAAGAPFDQGVKAQLVSIRDRVEDLAAEAGAINGQLIAYQSTMKAYAELIRAVQRSIEALQRAVEEARPGFPRTDELVELYIQLRQAYETYKSTR